MVSFLERNLSELTWKAKHTLKDRVPADNFNRSKMN